MYEVLKTQDGSHDHKDPLWFRALNNLKTYPAWMDCLFGLVCVYIHMQ